jgi:hypothetical protein
MFPVSSFIMFSSNVDSTISTCSSLRALGIRLCHRLAVRAACEVDSLGDEVQVKSHLALASLAGRGSEQLLRDRIVGRRQLDGRSGVEEVRLRMVTPRSSFLPLQSESTEAMT